MLRIATIEAIIIHSSAIVDHQKNSRMTSTWGIDGLLGVVLRTSDTVDNEGNGAIAGDVASCTETVHGNVYSNHQALHIGAEAKHTFDEAESGHDGTSGYTGCCDHRDAEHHNEAKVSAKVTRQTHTQGDGVGHSCNLEDAKACGWWHREER